jgi:hypothetical protein
MAKYSKQEFAKMCGWPVNKLAAYYSEKRKTRVVVGPNGLIDTDNPYNDAFLQKYKDDSGGNGSVSAGGAGAAAVNAATVSVGVVPVAGAPMVLPESGGLKGQIVVGDSGQMIVVAQHDGGQVVIELETIPDFKESERLLKFLDTVKRKKETQKLDIEIAKKNGEVVPTDVILPVFTRHNTHLLTSFKNASEAILTEYSKIRDLNTEEIAHIRASIIAETNKAIMKATELTESDVKGIVDDYAAKKGVGERGS